MRTNALQLVWSLKLILRRVIAKKTVELHVAQLAGKNTRLNIRPWATVKCFCVNWMNRLLSNASWHFLTLARTCYFPILERTWGWLPSLCHFAPNWGRAVGLRLNESWGRSEFNSTRVDLFSSYIDPSSSGQNKRDGDFEMYRSSQIFFELNKIADSF